MNATTRSFSTESDVIPYWMIIVWCIACVLALILVLVAIYYSYVICCQRKKRQQKRPYPYCQDPRHLIDNYPQALIEHLYKGNIHARPMFSQSFVDHMRIPRAMEVKIVASVNSLNNAFPLPVYNPTIQSPVEENDCLEEDLFSFSTERIPPSREQSFRYQNMSSEESKERYHKEKLLVSELREKLRNQRTMFDE
ncbi:uncharacterized protein [Acropora muricata]|uniref:uncharacterized protein LOC114951563 n=1 Tax=Acropora millepora TaxID=45264 RepID=UPI001CF2A439|nr:uncharacterized protein LOC114951563 [Acropora millepora]